MSWPDNLIPEALHGHRVNRVVMSQVNRTQGTSPSSVLSVSKERVVMALSLVRGPEIIICVLREAREEKE